ncbi:hypothetical protein BHM03_00020686 [Ensete ventricosum]|nr:hypothetical protein BHM03_00020686 [Ensete ventricosum]
MRLGTRQECVGSLPWVSGACQDGAREFARRRSRLTEKLSGVVEKRVGSWEGLEVDIIHGPRIKLRHRVKDWTMRRELVGSSLGDLPKGLGSLLETRQRKTVRLAAVEFGGCRITGVRL